MTFNVRAVDLGKLNSLTKYPSILTYHQLDAANGGLLETPTRFTGLVLATEKVDGTNARIIFLPDGSYLIGSRIRIEGDPQQAALPGGVGGHRDERGRQQRTVFDHPDAPALLQDEDAPIGSQPHRH